MTKQKPSTRTEAAVRLQQVAENLLELSKMPVNRLTQHPALHKARVALEDYEDASKREP